MRLVDDEKWHTALVETSHQALAVFGRAHDALGRGVQQAYVSQAQLLERLVGQDLVRLANSKKKFQFFSKIYPRQSLKVLLRLFFLVRRDFVLCKSCTLSFTGCVSIAAFL